MDRQYPQLLPVQINAVIVICYAAVSHPAHHGKRLTWRTAAEHPCPGITERETYSAIDLSLIDDSEFGLPCPVARSGRSFREGLEALAPCDVSTEMRIDGNIRARELVIKAAKFERLVSPVLHFNGE